MSAPVSMRLWQLISPTLPVGAYSYSTGLEYAVEQGWVQDADSAADWILGLLQQNLSRQDVPIFLRLHRCFEQRDFQQALDWNRVILALRESAELKQEDLGLGAALLKVLQSLSVPLPELGADEALSYITVFAYACAHWQIGAVESVQGYLWAWCENQVAAAVKLVPLGQSAGQKILYRAATSIDAACRTGETCSDHEIGVLSPGLAMASALHETQYSRLFRS